MSNTAWHGEWTTFINFKMNNYQVINPFNFHGLEYT